MVPHLDRRDAFFADAMLGRLARWLRILGYDTAYEKDIPDEVLAERVIREERWLLTRDRFLARRRVLRDRLTLLRNDNVDDQLRQLMVEHHLDFSLDRETPCRCAECNVKLESFSHEEATKQVPPFVALEHTKFSRCSGCGRIYWPGTHWKRIRLRLNHVKER